MSISGKLRGTPTYNTWGNMIQRCTNPKATDYQHYGGRGIQVCDRWRKFENFVEDMGIRPVGTTLDRRDTNSDYCKENCMWSLPEVQQNNKRTNVLILIDGQEYTVKEAAILLDLAESTVYNKTRKGELKRISLANCVVPVSGR